MTAGPAQAELVRRLQRHSAADSLEPAVLGRLLERAERRPVPGRGPATGAAEVLRAGTGLLVDLLLETPPARPSRRTPGSARVTVLGAPGNADAVRALFPRRLIDRRDSVVLLQVAPLDEMLGQVWSARVRGGSQARWSGFVTRFARRDLLPEPLDIESLLCSRPSPQHVIAAADPAEARRTTARALGLPQPADPRPVLDAPAVEVVRRANEVLAVRASPAPARSAREALVETLLPPRRTAGGSVGITVPPAHRDWAARTSEHLIQRLQAGRYPVHGDLDLLRSRGDVPHRPGVARALELTLGACLRLAGAEQRSEVRRR